MPSLTRPSTSGLAKTRPQLVVELQHIAGIAEQDLAFTRQREVPLVAAEDRPPDRALQSFRLVGHGWLRAADDAARRGQAAGFDDGDECSQQRKIELDFHAS